jgi:2-polyprenyl-6-methoxyphenol hydroxylase-like FAD-dependent oxidoreductase
LEPRLDRWVYGKNRRIVLVGDAAHPPAPYIDQGAQMGVEDAGTLALLLKELCLDDLALLLKELCLDEEGNLDLTNFGQATRIYEKLRIPRTSKVLDSSKHLGSLQDRRSHTTSQAIEEDMLKGEVMMNDTLPIMFTGATYNYSEEVMMALLQEKRWKSTERTSMNSCTQAKIRCERHL